MTREQEEALYTRARERIARGLLPREKPTRMWGGHGTGQSCSLCDNPISESEPEMELEYEPAVRASSVRFHLRCQSLWDVARQLPDASQWISVEDEMPPLHTVVEARIALGSAARSLILNVMRVCDGESGPVVWLNATTNSGLPDSWRPMQWRTVQVPEPSATAPDIHASDIRAPELRAPEPPTSAPTLTRRA